MGGPPDMQRPNARRRLTVVIPTYQRPDWVGPATLSLARQSVPPHEVVIVARDTDVATHEAVRRLQRGELPFELVLAFVSQPGFMPPVERGIAEASGDVIAVMDDDAEALEDWCERLLAQYEDPTVGAVGGRCINMQGDQVLPVPMASRIGRIDPIGRIHGNHYKQPQFEHPVDVDFLMGGCMSYRRDVARSLEFDMRLNRGVAFNYEIDLGLQVKRRGLRVVFDPKAAVRHYSAPRAEAGMRRRDDEESVRWATYNELRVALRRLNAWRAGVVATRAILLGSRAHPGLLPLAAGPLARRLGFELPVGIAASRGRLRALVDAATKP